MERSIGALLIYFYRIILKKPQAKPSEAFFIGLAGRLVLRYSDRLDLNPPTIVGGFRKEYFSFPEATISC